MAVYKVRDKKEKNPPGGGGFFVIFVQKRVGSVSILFDEHFDSEGSGLDDIDTG